MKNYNKSLSGEMDVVCDDQTVSGYFTSDTVDVDGHIIFKEDIIANQIHNLIKHKQIDSIRIDDVKIFSHYSKMDGELNAKQNDLLSKIHTTTMT